MKSLSNPNLNYTMQKNCQRPCSVSREVKQKRFEPHTELKRKWALVPFNRDKRLKDEDNSQYEIWIKVFTRILKI